MKAIHLKTEYLYNPIGIDILHPRFTWTCDKGILQKSFQVRIFDEDGQIYDDSGVVDSHLMHYTYSGKQLVSKQCLYWHVTIADEHNAVEVSDVAMFEMGLLSPQDFHAPWISGQDTSTEIRLNLDYFEKKFNVDQPIKKARLYITALGTYEVKINNETATDFYLAPGSTQYDKRLYYQTYDVTHLIKSENTMIIMLGDGWYKGKLGCDSDECLFGNQTMVKAQLEITNHDNLIQTVITDHTVLWSNEGPIEYNDIKDGVVIDFNKHLSFTKHAKLNTSNTIPQASLGPKLIVKEHIKPKLLYAPSGKIILDFEQNFSGSIAFKVQGLKGQKVNLKAFEVLNHGEYCDYTFRT